MPSADDFLKSWVDQLSTMQNCMKAINTDTDLDLKGFYSQKHADLLLSSMQKEQFRSCFFQHTNLTMPDADFANGSTFHELLDLCYRPLLVAVVALMRDEAASHGGPFGGMSVSQFGAVKCSAAFPAASVDALCVRLEASMKPLFSASNTAFRAQLAKPAATVLQAAQAIL